MLQPNGVACEYVRIENSLAVHERVQDGGVAREYVRISSHSQHSVSRSGSDATREYVRILVYVLCHPRTGEPMTQPVNTCESKNIIF